MYFIAIKRKLGLNSSCRHGGRIMINVHRRRAQVIRTSEKIHLAYFK